MMNSSSSASVASKALPAPARSASAADVAQSVDPWGYAREYSASAKRRRDLQLDDEGSSGCVEAAVGVTQEV